MIINPYAFGVSYDPDAQAFFTASGLTGTTNLNAINQLVLDLKSYGIWTKMKAIYPFVGGTAALHKWNLKDPRDLDAAFRLVFSGGNTHDANGWTPNGTNGYADTKLIPSINFTKFNHHISLYSRTNNQTNAWNGAFISQSLTERFIIRSTDAPSGRFLYWSYGSSTSAIDTPNSNSTGLFVATNRNASDRKVFRNGATLATNTYDMTPFTLINIRLFIGSNNVNGTPTTYDNKQIAFGSLGDGLTDTEAANFYTAVQAFNTTLNRQV